MTTLRFNMTLCDTPERFTATIDDLFDIPDVEWLVMHHDSGHYAIVHRSTAWTVHSSVKMGQQRLLARLSEPDIAAAVAVRAWMRIDTW